MEQKPKISDYYFSHEGINSLNFAGILKTKSFTKNPPQIKSTSLDSIFGLPAKNSAIL